MTRLPHTYRHPDQVKAASRRWLESRAIKAGDGVVILSGVQRVRWEREHLTIEHEATQ